MNANPTRGRNDRMRRATVTLAAWTAAWLLTLATATFVPTALLPGNVIVALAAIALNIVVGIGMIRANKKHLEVQDELHQRMQLEAMSVTLGLAMVVGLAWSTLGTAGVLAFESQISHLVVFIALTYLSALAVLHWKYR
jgi:hypothetical protein